MQRKAARGRERAIARLTAHNPEAAAVFDRVDPAYWREEIRDHESGALLGTRARRGDERAAYLATTKDVNVVRLGLADKQPEVRAAAAAHPLATQAREPLQVPAGDLTPTQAANLARYRAHLEGLPAERVTQAHWDYLAAGEEHYRGLRPPVLSPEQEAAWQAHRDRLTGRAQQRFVADRYRTEWQWLATHGKTTEDWATWWARKRRALRDDAIRSGRVVPRPASVRIDWDTISYTEADAAVRAGTIPVSQVPLDVRGWRLRDRWRAELAAEGGNEEVGHAVDLAAEFNTRPGRARVRAIPLEDGSIRVESLRGAPRAIDTWVDLRGLTGQEARDRFERAVAGFWASGTAQAA
ncbi:hypothetical protein GXB85_13560 [Cellulomonas sp. APG4]|uniref:hypothetical protein n=1 Tax=Cellulomonas sp. APG4 TaxID=1538656 RepID=UPI00137ACED6|nr:hypothetical protein [Cellulomonas sp. APG4]NCT91969.1 hypothetical protein [Cellulomonas sp. APG4]